MTETEKAKLGALQTVVINETHASSWFHDRSRDNLRN